MRAIVTLGCVGLLLASCMRIVIAPDAQRVSAWILGNGHATVCHSLGETQRRRSPLGAPQGEHTPVATEVPDVRVQGPCTDITGSSTSSNLVLAVGLLAAAVATVIALLA